MSAAITIRGLSKRYRLAPQRAHMLREFLVDQLRMQWKRAWNQEQNGSRTADWFWALKDVSFEVEEGEVIGIIGSNGAGKSTLMKILSRITDPTEGSAKFRGRLASLLEVGSGFHPELTGKENIYLKGAILGMRRAEVRSKFDQIIGFAEVEKFLDVPVKHYSSGMYVRLAFAVAAHLDPDILLVDEVLAVGDLAFQTKCLKKLGGLTRNGQTALFVSHNMAAVENLCRRVIVLERGRLAFSGTAREGVNYYIGGSRREIAHAHSIDLTGSSGRPPNWCLPGLQQHARATDLHSPYLFSTRISREGASRQASVRLRDPEFCIGARRIQGQGQYRYWQRIGRRRGRRGAFEGYRV